MARKPALANSHNETIAHQTLILDNGACTLKTGFASGDEPNPSNCHIIPNCIARSQRDKRTYIGAELYDCADYGELAFRRPVEKGYVVNWEGEKAVWEKTFMGKTARVKCDAHETNLILTEAPHAPAALQRNADEMVFEEFEFASYFRSAAPNLNAYAPSPFPGATALPCGMALETILLVDAGHTATTITPLYHGRPIQQACRRLDIGGKTLSNQLKELISRTFDVHREDWIVSEIKEDVCYVSSSFNSDMERAWKGGLKDPREVDSTVVVDYVLPDYEEIKRGYTRPHETNVSIRNRALGMSNGRKEHVVTIGNERFAVPELLFTPTDIGMQQEGLCGTILQSLESVPKSLWHVFLANIVVVGGTSKLPGFVDRLEAELRSRVDETALVRVACAEDPIKNTWLGGARLAGNPDVLRELVVTRAEYLEHGDLWTRRKFAGKTTR
ncbi:actin-like protein arp6 [Acrodontium crateriforme]|uniref:Actin-like protein ARP6 n=1 Tax=Acrodontium crateriforme TaxID=150365 RepID=A0AAQ3R678_9PEZI|nr:actin-like protein arp6 [Acrodontium crateriforme]